MYLPVPYEWILGPFENDKQTKFQNLLGSRSVLLTRQISQYAHYATPERYASVLLANCFRWVFIYASFERPSLST